MQERLQLGSNVEISYLAPQHEVDDEGRTRSDVPAEIRELGAKQHPPAEEEARCQHHDQGGKDATRAMSVKVEERELVGSQAPENDGRYQEARDDEEHVDADKTAGHLAREGMESHDRQDRQRPQTI